MSREGPSGMFRVGKGMAKGMKKAQTYGINLVNGNGPVGVTMKTLGLAEHFADIKEEIEKLENLEKRMYERMSLAEEALANAKRSPHLKNVGSVDLLEGTLEDIQEYMDWLGTSGPLLRGASYHEMNPQLEMMLEWITDALVALQVDTMLAVINGDVDGDIPWVAPQGCTPPGYGEESGQAVNPGNQAGDNMRDQHPQPFLIPPQMHPVLRHPLKHQAIPPALASEVALRGTGAFVPNGGAEWPNNAHGVHSMMMHHTPATMACAPIGYDGAGWSNNSCAAFWTRHQTPVTVEGPIGSNMDAVSTEAREPPRVDSGREKIRAMWPNHGNPSSFRSLTSTESIGSDGATSPVLLDSASVTTGKAAWATVDEAKLPHPVYYDSCATKSMFEKPSIDSNTWSHHFDSTSHSHPTHRIPSGKRNQGAQRPRLSDANYELPAKIPGAFGPHVVYNSAGRPYYPDADTGHHYPAGWGRHP